MNKKSFAATFSYKKKMEIKSLTCRMKVYQKADLQPTLQYVVFQKKYFQFCLLQH